MGENKYRYLWKYVREVEKTESCIYVFLDRGADLYIPRHAFELEEKYGSFYEALNSHEVQNR
ncbi:YcxB family protein [Gammaproteobacteria bacterium AH-315-C21]|nr:YcxB family protein [Gammaproteobacteria bacterium AH-315-C21]